MPLGQQILIAVGAPLLLALFVGLIARRRSADCYTFPPYIAAVCLSDLLILGWPASFFTWDFWLIKETVHAVLKFAIALELALRVFRHFPGALATARGVALTVVAVTWVGLVAVPGDRGDYGILAGELHPRILSGTIWLFVAIAALVVWYRLPVDAFQKAILLGFAPYLLVFAVAMNALTVYGWELSTLSGYVHSGAYFTLVAYWNYAAWRRDAVSVGVQQPVATAARA